MNVVAAYGPKGAHAELGPGLYVSNAPEFWMSRSTGKWAFLDTLTARQRDKLIDALRERVDELNSRGRVSRSEHDYALRTLHAVWQGDARPPLLVGLANQPYSIAFWRETFLAPLGIAVAPPPRVVEVEIAGRFVEIAHKRPAASLLRTLRRAGFQGAYVRPTMGNAPEMVVWDARAVRGTRTLRD